MPDTLTSLADMVKINDVSVRDAGATDIFNGAPLLQILNALEASHGTNHEYLRETGAPTVGFRAENTGRDWTTDGDTLVSMALKILDASYGVDKAIADAYVKGADALMARKGRRSLRAAFAAAEKQLLYGTGNDAAGFLGLAQVMNDTADARVVNAGGAVACTSIWAIRTTGDEKDVAVIVGKGGNIDLAPYFQTILKDGTGKSFPGYAQAITGYIGMTIGTQFSVARLANVGTDQPLTDARLSLLFELFKEDAPPTHFVMNRRSQMQLQRSRTTYSPTGSEAKIPDNWNGIPFVITQSIGNAETALNSTPIANAAATAM